MLPRLKSALAALPDGCPSEIIVVDDGSSDATLEVARGEDVITVAHPGKKGYGIAVLTGLKKARYPVIALIEADGSYPPEEIPRLVGAMADVDMVVGARTGPGQHEPLGDRLRRFCYRRLVEYTTGETVPDADSRLRVFKRDVALRFKHLLFRGYSFTTSLTLGMLGSGYFVEFIPISVGRRIGKARDRRLRDLLGAGQITLRMMTVFNPVKVFLPIAIGFFLLSVLFFVLMFVLRNSVAALLSGLSFISSVHFLSMGFLADLLIRVTRKLDEYKRQ